MSNKGLSQVDVLLADSLCFMISRLSTMRPADGPILFWPALKGPTSLALSNSTAPEFRLIH